ncbi:MAG: aminotransferase class I/II-fold pyridoxal phosphate-dependent enzyme [Lewinellaceae bacterium]|nr:aminotransferase class I/II-fold pyridoxal phosphate-dependent enzyme [Phaeodactylibacter sp.]MCB9035249.1 aminotransferase class I/II-fold pyridoxal phosphate-dependent enzyme [Lewinellaceae bacterium]
MINLISDTVTKPTPGMLQAMLNAEVGDDVFGEDPTVNALEAKVAALFNKEAAVFCPSGTMTNQIAIKVHTQPLDEVVCDEYSHIYQYEAGGYAYNSGVAINLLRGVHGKITAAQVEEAIKPEFDWLPRTRLVVLENTCNKGGGSYYTLDEVRPVSKLCWQRGLALHLDGARIFNALVETGEPPQAIGEQFDSISVCLSKGLGAPVGSVLIGSKAFIKQARRFRKVMGGGMRQAGYLAAAGIYALDHQVERLKEDNERARKIGAVLAEMLYVSEVRPVRTNILIFDVKPPYTAASFLEELAGKGIKASPFGPQTVRFVTHLDFSEEMMERVIAVLKGLGK